MVLNAIPGKCVLSFGSWLLVGYDFLVLFLGLCLFVC